MHDIVASVSLLDHPVPHTMGFLRAVLGPIHFVPIERRGRRRSLEGYQCALFGRGVRCRAVCKTHLTCLLRRSNCYFFGPLVCYNICHVANLSLTGYHSVPQRPSPTPPTRCAACARINHVHVRTWTRERLATDGGRFGLRFFDKQKA